VSINTRERFGALFYGSLASLYHSVGRHFIMLAADFSRM
jgi:hypothetical protein